MPRIDIGRVPAQQIASYPKEFAQVISGREKQRIGDAVGLTQFGVNITRIRAGSASALRHWHEQEDEFIYMLEGELVLCENDGETVLKAGDAAGRRYFRKSGERTEGEASRARGGPGRTGAPPSIFA